MDTNSGSVLDLLLPSLKYFVRLEINLSNHKESNTTELRKELGIEEDDEESESD